MAFVRFAAGLVALAAVAGAAEAKEPPPLAAFARLPALESVDISPDGKRLALLGGPAGARTLAIATIDGPTGAPIRLGDVAAISADWVGNEHVVVRVARWEQVDGKAYRMERNIAFTSEGKLAATLLVHGGQDTIVEPAQSAAMRDALTAAGKPVEHLLLADDDHYLRRPQSRTQLLTALEAFLARHLPVAR